MNLSHTELQSFLDPFYRTYVCRDGRPFYVVNSPFGVGFAAPTYARPTFSEGGYA